MKAPFVLLMFLLSLTANSQSADYISVRKWTGKTMKNFYQGSNILLQTTDGSILQGPIKSIRNDSVYLTIYTTRYFPTIWGTRQLDTISIVDLGLKFKEISRIHFGKKSGFFARNAGPLMMIGGTGYLSLNLLNALTLPGSVTDRDNLRKISIAGGIVVVGYFLNKLLYSDGFTNKKYKIHYVDLSKRKPI
ncbi:MAG: hypothetical protein ACM3VS_05730 [Candidatus Dadabacteria bacterium]